jgi:polyhydroxybutyrate depolymerase
MARARTPGALCTRKLGALSACAALTFSCAGSATLAPAEAKSGAAPAAPPAPVGVAVAPSPSSGCGRPIGPMGEQVIHAGQLETPYLLTLPADYDGHSPVPLVFAFHGRTRSHTSMHDTDASHLAEALGSHYAVAYVKSIGPGFDWPKEQRDGLEIFDALYAHLLGDYCVDTEQVFALGHSSGALFSELLSCQRAPLLRGIAAVAGALAGPECPGHTAALLIHGDHDKVVSLSRGQTARDHFLRANGCSNAAFAIGAPGCVSYSGCEPSSPVEWCTHGEPTYQDTNHGWPSFASGEIARFFGTLGRVPHVAGTSLIGNQSFDHGLEPWQVSFSGNAKGKSRVEGGALCVTLDDAGENPWDAQIQYPDLKPAGGHAYIVDYRLWTSAPTDVRVKLGLVAQPYTEYWMQSVAAAEQPKRVTERFDLVETPPGPLGFAFQFAGAYAHTVPVTLCVDEVSLTPAPEGAQPPSAPR